MSTIPTDRIRRLVVLSGGTSEPSSTRMLADRIAARVTDRAGQDGIVLDTAVIELRPLAADIASAQVTGFNPPAVDAAVRTLAEADALVLATPVYKAGISGLVKSFLDLIDTDLLIAVPTVLAATAGTGRHALVPDEQLRALFAYLRALPVPTSVFAAGEDWGSSALGERIERAAAELAVLLEADVRERIRSESWQRYQHEFGSAAGGGIDLDSDLMRLAAGGSAA